MPVAITDVDAFTDPATRPGDGDLGNGATWLAPFQALANRTRHLANRLGGATGIGEWHYTGTKARKRVLNISRFAFATDGAGASSWAVTHSGGDAYARPLANGVLARCALDMPAEAILTSAEIWIKTSSSRAGAARWSLRVYKQVMGASAPGAITLLGSAADDGGATGTMKLTVSGLTEDVFNETILYYLVVQGPDTPIVNDDLYAARVNFTALGPPEG